MMLIPHNPDPWERWATFQHRRIMRFYKWIRWTTALSLVPLVAMAGARVIWPDAEWSAIAFMVAAAVSFAVSLHALILLSVMK